MPFTTLVSTAELSQHLTDPDWAVVDCRFTLTEAERGRRDYYQAHIPCALYAHVDEDLAGTVVRGRTGRHPLPDVDVMAQRLSRWGIDSSVQVVAYDDSGGSMAARLWWLLRWLGHDAVAVLDGGFPKWQREGREARAGVESRSPRTFVPNVRAAMVVHTPNVLAALEDASLRLLDSRTADRYRGENETIDPVAGHIPGAISAPYPDNLDAGEAFKSQAELRARFQALLGDAPAERAVFYCGSGVTAAHNILAMQHAGLGEARLYAGSWSEWIADSSRPIRTGEE